MELGLFIVALVAIVSGAAISTNRHMRYRKALERLAQVEIDKLTISNALLDAKQEIENYKLGETEDFVKFLSTSRQWAFDFIDEIQSTLNELFEMIKDPNQDTQELLSKFQELKKFLPKEVV